MKEIGDNIRTICEQKGLLQQDLAAACNLETSAMSRIEAAGSHITVATMLKISTALEVPITDLFDGR